MAKDSKADYKIACLNAGIVPEVLSVNLSLRNSVCETINT